MIKMKSQQTSITNSFLLIETGISFWSHTKTQYKQLVSPSTSRQPDSLAFIFFPQKHTIKFTRPQSLIFAELPQKVCKGEMCT